MHFDKALIKLLQSPDYKPIHKEAIANVLKISKEERQNFFQSISRLIEEKRITQGKHQKIQLVREHRTNDYLSGVIKFKQNGSGLFFPEGSAADANPYTVSAQDSHIALHGDTVLGRIIKKKKQPIRSRPKRGARTKRASRDSSEPIPFRVLKILDRARETHIGTYTDANATHAYITADDPRIIPEFIINKATLSKQTATVESGDKVVFRIVNWSQRALQPEAELIEILGKTHEPKAEFKAILLRYNLETDFPKAVQKDAARLPEQVGKKDRAGRLDLRKDYTFTIDPEDAKDFDDALSIVPIDEDRLRIAVHIADVSAYVKPKSALDVEAQNRGNSTYLVGTVIPMLPHSLSNGLCSLVEGEDRLTKSVLLEFNRAGTIEKVDFANTVIRSNKRLTYKQALAFLQEEDLDRIAQTPLPPKHQTGSIGRALDTLDHAELAQLKSSIRSLWSIASQLRAKRFEKGSLDLDMNELKIYVDKEGYADRLEKQENDISHQLIEEFMLVANEQVARLCKRERIAAVYRVHDKPEEAKLSELRQVMQTYGVPCNQLSKPSEMARLLKRLKDHPQAYALKLNVLKSLKQAQYRSTPDGHYGLAKTDYTHFTSPIRRYSDLIVHRIFDRYLHRAKLKSAPPSIEINYNQSTLESITQHLNIMERNSVDAERESTKVKLLEYFEQETQLSPLNHFDAVITDIKKHGLFIELIESQAFGFVHISNLGEDHYFVSSNENSIVGKRDRQIFNLGDRIKVSVLKVDRFKRQIDFKIAELETAQTQQNKARGKGRNYQASSAKELNKLRKQRRSARKH